MFDIIILFSEDMKVILWDLKDGIMISTFAEHEFPITGVVVSKNGLTAISVDEGGIMIVWDVWSSEILFKLRAHTGAITCVAIDSSGNRVVTGNNTQKGNTSFS